MRSLVPDACPLFVCRSCSSCFRVAGTRASTRPGTRGTALGSAGSVGFGSLAVRAPGTPTLKTAKVILSRANIRIKPKTPEMRGITSAEDEARHVGHTHTKFKPKIAKI